MTTIVDPFGTPSEFYNRSGTTVQEITLSPSSTINLNSASSTTIVILSVPTPVTSADYVVLPANCEVGDSVEFYNYTGNNGYAFPPSGENILGFTNAEQIPGYSAKKFFKFNSTSWVRAD